MCNSDILVGETETCFDLRKFQVNKKSCIRYNKSRSRT